MMHKLKTLALVILVAVSGVGQAQEVDFELNIAPILEERCWGCHGADEQESGLRIDQRPRMLRGGDSGLATVVPGKPEKSYLIEVINHVDEDMAMPPDEDKLPAKEIELLTRWIKEGANWPGQMDAVLDESSDHWSFQPVARPEIPSEPTAIAASLSPVDAFLLKATSRQQTDLLHTRRSTLHNPPCVHCAHRHRSHT